MILVRNGQLGLVVFLGLGLVAAMRRRVRRTFEGMTTPIRLHLFVGISLLAIAAAPPQTAHAQIVVTTTADNVVGADCVTPGSATCTLRAALLRVVQPAVNPRRIVFNLPGPAPHVIRVDPALGPLLWEGAGAANSELDGLSQLGAGRRVGSDPNNPVDYVLTVGIAAPPLQTLDGPLLIMRGSSSVLRGIAFFDHDGVGVRLERGSITASFFNTLDGTNPGPRRLTKGVDFVATNGSSGSNGVFSSLFMGPGVGIEINDARTAGSQAIVNALLGENYFGTDRTGLLSRPVSYGVLAQIVTAPPVIGGAPSPVQANIRGSLFYAAEDNAIRLRGLRPSVGDSAIGYDANGARVIGTPPANQGAGILLEGPTHGAQGAGGGVSGVRIYGQRGPGIQLVDTLGPILNVLLEPSSLFGNGGLGISLLPGSLVTPTPNDAGDADGGPNGRQNYPVLTSIARILDENDEEQIAVGLTLESSPDRDYNLYFFASSQCHPSGYGEGEVYLFPGREPVRTDASGTFTGVVTLALDVNNALARLQGRPFVTAFASVAPIGGDAEDYNTSEFSACLHAGDLLPPGQRLGFDQTEYTYLEGQTASVTVRRTGGTAGEIRVRLQTSSGSAVAGRDYTAVDQELVFADGIASYSVQIPLRPENTTSEPTRELTVGLLTPTGGATIDPFRETATVQIFDDDASLTVTDSQGAVNDGLIDFGAVEFGSFHEATVTLRNPGAATVQFNTPPALAPSGPSLTEVANTCGLTLAPDAECVITVRFTAGNTPSAVTGEVRILPINVAPTAVAVSGSTPPRADLAVLIGASPPNPEPGATVDFSVAALNRGPADAESSEVRIALPAELALDLGTLAPTQGTASFDAASRVITWLTGALTVGPSSPATLTVSATVNAAVGTNLATAAAIALTDANRVDPRAEDNTSEATIAVGVRAADLYIQEVLFPGRPEGATIPIQRRCTADSVSECGREADSSTPLSVTIRNNGPDTPSEPVALRITSGFCFASEWRGVPHDYASHCLHGPVFQQVVDPASLPPGVSATINARFWALSGPTGLETLQVEIVHATFDPNPDNNSADSPGITVTIPAPGGDRGSGIGFNSLGDYCFIATAAYGSWLDPHVVKLREFRDRWLLTHAPGRAFVAWYYRVSPPLADWIAERAWARAVVRTVLAPIVFAITYPLAALALVVLVACGWRNRTRLAIRLRGALA